MEILKFNEEIWEIELTPEAVEINPFKILWDRDKAKDKSLARKELAFIKLFSDYKSDYSDIIDEQERADTLKNDLVLPEKWKADDKIKDAVAFYKGHETLIVKAYNGAKLGLDKLDKFLQAIDLNERDEKGKPIHNPKTIYDLINALPTAVRSLRDAEEEVRKEREVDSKMKGQKEKSIFEDGV